MLPGKIILTPFPFGDLSSTKVRPALCLTETIGSYKELIIAYISSQQIESLLPTDILLSNNSPSFSQTGLKVTSVVRLHKLVTINLEIVRHELGRLSPNQFEQVRTKLYGLFGL